MDIFLLNLEEKVKKELKRYYLTADKYFERIDSFDEGAFEEYVSFVSRYLQKGQLVLDIGCGTGLSSLMLRKRGYRIIGVDISSLAIKRAKKREQTNLKYLVCDVLNLPFKDNQFDVVASCLLIEHITDINVALYEMVRVTRIGGKIIILSPNLLSPFSQVYNILINLHFRKDKKSKSLVSSDNLMNSFFHLFRNIYLLLIKRLSRREKFLYRKPILESKFNFIPDNDAVYLSNPVDLLKWFKRRKLKVIKYQGKTIGGRLLPDFATGIHMVVKK
ncbi:MAG: methyltransferase domain-containing protein [Candidatus Omnitrophica bacterium]|nr:methyltransferase domain-containing protein [Candidatus Omnitrophota bacterium]